MTPRSLPIAVLAAALVTMSGAGCATTVGGTPVAAPTSSARTIPPLVVPTTPAPSAPEALSWATTTDPTTGTSAEMPGAALASDITVENYKPGLGPIPARLYQVQTRRSGTVQLLLMQRLPGGIFDFENDVQVAATEVSGTVVSKQPVTVDGHNGLDFVITYRSTEGKPSVVHKRILEASGFAVVISTRGVNKDPATVAEVHERAAASLRVPAP